MSETSQQTKIAQDFEHYRLPRERVFSVESQDQVTILFGGLTWKHERLILGLLEAEGYLCERIPETDRTAHELGKEFCANGLCNPVYFTVGSLLKKLRSLEEAGLSPKEIVDRFVFFTAACGGPCRFGLYEAEFRTALRAAGYEGFRILSFSQDHGIHASTGHSGLKFSVDFGFNTLHTFILGDLLHDLQHRLRAFEVHIGSTDRAIQAATDHIAGFYARNSFDLAEGAPGFLRRYIQSRRESRWYRFPNTLGKIGFHLMRQRLPEELLACQRQIQKVEVDWLRVKPVVKVIGEFWAQMTESDGNFRMLEFLESEGAEVAVEPISTWILYMLHQRKARTAMAFSCTRYSRSLRSPLGLLAAWLRYIGKQLAFTAGEKIYRHHYARLAHCLGELNHPLIKQEELARLAAPHFNTFLRGGEGHLEVGKNLYYTLHRASHMVLALKPFGCLPSTQSDGVQAALVERYPEMNFLSIETAAEGSIHAYSRAQMALAEAKAKAREEFRSALASTHQSLPAIREFVAMHSELRHPFYQIPRRPGIVSTAANFLLHVNDLMCGHDRGNPRSRSEEKLAFEESPVNVIRSTQEVGNNV